MNDVNFSTFYSAVNELTRQLQSIDLSWEYITEQKTFSTMYDRLAKSNPTEQFDFPFFDFTEQNAFFIIIKDLTGDVVSVQAARMEDIGRSCLANFWGSSENPGQQIRLYADRDGTAQLGDKHSPGAFTINRRVVFHGNVYTTKYWRRRGATGIFVRLGLLTILNRWKPDYVYGLMDPYLASKGWAVQAGYFQAEPSGVHWVVPPEHIGKDDYLVYNDFEQLLHLMEVTADNRVGFDLLKSPEAVQLADMRGAGD